VCRCQCLVFITANGPAPNENGREGAIGREETAGLDCENVKISKREDWIRRRAVWFAGFPLGRLVHSRSEHKTAPLHDLLL
jgi:hypothetical protein